MAENNQLKWILLLYWYKLSWRENLALYCIELQMQDLELSFVA